MAEQSGAAMRLLKRWRGQSSSSSAATKDYDVLLNHRGPDVKGGFVAHLEEALRAAGLNPFLDKSSLAKGEPAFGGIDAALEVAKVHVAVVSPGYAESKFCLSELAAMMASAKPVIPVFYDVEPAALRRVERGEFAAAFEKHKSRESAEQVQEWAAALSKLADITGVCFRLCDYKGDEVQLKWEVVDAVMSLLPAIEDVLQVDQHLVGLEVHMNTCINQLARMHGSTFILCIAGMGGVGKTTFTKAIYNHYIGHKKFEAMSYLEIDRNLPFNMEAGANVVTSLQKQLLWDILLVPNGNQQRYNYWFNKISSQGPVLVVLDDIHDQIQFEKLIPDTNIFAPGSCIIVTSRDQHLLKRICKGCKSYLHEITPLGCDDSKKLFNWHAFGGKEVPTSFKSLASDVSKACGGLPLALKVVGSNLSVMTLDEDQKYIWSEAINAMKQNCDVISTLRWSYDCLSKPEKLMFVDIACVFHGWEKEESLEVWHGCKECSSCCGCEAPHTYLRSLIDKSLVVIERVGERHFLVMHNLLRDMGQSIGIVDGSHLWKGKKATKVVEDRNQVLNKVRAINLTNHHKHTFEIEKFPKMPNLYYLILDGCHVSGDLGSLSKELRWLQWRYMPLMHVPPISNLFNLVTLDFSQSTNLANIWAESNPTLECCPNLLKLDMTLCTSVTALPESIGRLSRLQVLDLDRCQALRRLPNSIGQLTALKDLRIQACRSLEALPDSISALSGLQKLQMNWCESISKLPTRIGLPTGVTIIYIDLVSEAQAVAIGQLNALQELFVWQGRDEAITALDTSGALGNLAQLSILQFRGCTSITKLPQTLELLTNLDRLYLYSCEKLQELPNSVGQLKVLTQLHVRNCSSLESLPDSLGALTSLQYLVIEKCTSLAELPTSIGLLSRLYMLWIEGCGVLQPLPESLKQLKALGHLMIKECGSLEGLGLLRVLQGLRIWGCTSITELPGSCLYVMDSKFRNPALFKDGDEYCWARRRVRELRVVEANDCGFLRLVQDDSLSARLKLQRVHKSPCCKATACV